MSAKETVLFDRALLLKRRDRIAKNISEFDFLFKEVADNVLDSMEAIKNRFPFVLNMHDINRYLADKLKAREGTKDIITSDLSSKMRADVVIDEEFLPFAKNSFDAVVSVLNLHKVNDLPGALVQIKQSLKPNSMFIGALIGGESLKELRQSLMEAELKVSGGASPRVLPFVDAYTMSSLMQRAGFELPVVDSEIITVKYPNIFKLMDDLRGMGETNILSQRLKTPSRKELFLEAGNIYQQKFSDSEGMLTASFDIIYLIGWTAVSK